MSLTSSPVLNERRTMFESAWKRLVAIRYGDGSKVDATALYILSGSGKRVRALLSILSSEMFGKSFYEALPAAVAVEMIHAYSLVHDDLPCMDDDDLRRGRPTAHVQFGEAMALLAGDAILTDAFSLLSDRAFVAQGLLEMADHEPATRMRLVRELAGAAGGRGMVRGQASDMEWTDRPEGATRETLDEIHLHKTGYLLGAACAMGAICAGADESATQVLRNFGQQLGLAFQIVDDVLDLQSDTGKSQGKDLAANKLTYLRFYTREEARARAREITDAAIESLVRFGMETKLLTQLATDLCERAK